jgi:hypothetical protein
VTSRVIRSAIIIAVFLATLSIGVRVVHAQTVTIGPSTQNINQVSVSTAYLYYNKLHFAGTWSGSLTYNSQDLVIYSGASYVSLQVANLNENPASASLYWVVLPGSGGGGLGTVTSVQVAGTANEIAVAGTCTITSTGVCTLSVPAGFVLPGTINGLTITTTGGTLTITGAKVLTVSNSLTLAGTDNVTLTFPSTNATIARTDSAQTFTGVQTFSTPIAGTSGGTGSANSGGLATVTGLLKDNGSGTISPGVGDTDYAAAPGQATVTPGGGVATYGSAAGINQWNLGSGSPVVLTGNISSSVCPTAATTAKAYLIHVQQDGTGGRTNVWPSCFVGFPTIAGEASANTWITATYDGTNFHPDPGNDSGHGVATEGAAPAGNPASGLGYPFYSSADHDLEYLNNAGGLMKAFLAGHDCNPVTGICTTTNGNTTTITVGSSTIALGSLTVASGACSAAQTATVTGTATTDTITTTFNADPTGAVGFQPSTSGMVTVIMYPTSNTVNAKVCNNTSGSITTGSVTVNVRVTR